MQAISPTDVQDSDALAVCRAIKELHSGIVTPNYESLLCQCYHRFLTRNSAAVVLDVGAHSGLHLDYFVRLSTAGRVIAFEPLPSFAEDLASRFRDTPNVSIRAMALGDTVGRVSFCRIPDAPEMSGFRKRITGTMDETTAELIEVQVETLDRQCADLDSVEYIKIDVEGAEIDCLRGGRKTIARHRPFISVEYGRPTYLSYGHTKMTLFVLVNEIGYVISDLFGNLIRSSDAWMRICDAAYWDYMLVPVERLDYWNELFDDLT